MTVSRFNVFLLVFVLTVSIAQLAVAQTIVLENGREDLTTGDNLDGIESVPVTASVVEIAGLNITVSGIGGTGSGSNELNSLADSLGVDTSGVTLGEGDDSDQFDSAFNESVTFQFDQAVVITELNFVGFEADETFVFGGTTINTIDLANNTTDIFNFVTPLSIPAFTDFSLAATAGTIGIEAITLTTESAPVVPEPGSFSLLGLVGLIGLATKRRK